MTTRDGRRTVNPPWGTSLDTFLDEDGIREAVKAEAATRRTRSFPELVQNRAARDPEFAAALLRKNVEATGTGQDDD
jgi:hypothetical protein